MSVSFQPVNLTRKTIYQVDSTWQKKRAFPPSGHVYKRDLSTKRILLNDEMLTVDNYYCGGIDRIMQDIFQQYHYAPVALLVENTTCAYAVAMMIDDYNVPIIVLYPEVYQENRDGIYVRRFATITP